MKKRDFDSRAALARRMSELAFALLSTSLLNHSAIAAPVNPGAGLDQHLGNLEQVYGPRLEAAEPSAPTVIIFFASWCGPCRHYMDQLKFRAGEWTAAGARMIAINVFESFDQKSNSAKLATYLDKLDPGFAVLSEDSGTRPLFDNLTKIPTIFLFDASGNEAWRFDRRTGAAAADLDELELVLKELIQ